MTKGGDGLQGINIKEDLDRVFDYFDDLPKVDKKLLKEVIGLIEKNEKKSSKELLDYIKYKFKLNDANEKKLEDSLWYQFTKDFDGGNALGQQMQGWVSRVENDGKNTHKEIKVPLYAFYADLEKLDKFIQYVIDKTNSLKIRKD